MANKIYPKEYKDIIKGLDEIMVLKSERKQLLKDVDKNRRKLRTKLTELSFIDDLIGIETDSSIMEKAVKSYLKHFGFNKVEHLAKVGEEDLRWFIGEDKLVIIEVSASPGCNAGDDTVGQITKRMGLRKQQFSKLELYGCTIISHDFKKPYSNRCANPFPLKMKEYAVASHVSLVTTTDLALIFIEIKNGKLKPEALVDLICTPGVFKDNLAQYKLEQSTPKE